MPQSIEIQRPRVVVRYLLSRCVSGVIGSLVRALSPTGVAMTQGASTESLGPDTCQQFLQGW